MFASFPDDKCLRNGCALHPVWSVLKWIGLIRLQRNYPMSPLQRQLQSVQSKVCSMQKKTHIGSPFATEVTGLLSSQNFHPTGKLAAQMKQLLATFHEQTPLKTSTTQRQASNYSSYQRMASMQIPGTRPCKHNVSHPSQQNTARRRRILEHYCTFAAFKRSLCCGDADIFSHVNLFDDKLVYATNK